MKSDIPIADIRRTSSIKMKTILVRADFLFTFVVEEDGFVVDDEGEQVSEDDGEERDREREERLQAAKRSSVDAGETKKSKRLRIIEDSSDDD